MFISEQNIDRNTSNQPKKAVSESGMRLAKRNVVKFRLTYKELTIAFGVAIAILVFAVTYASGQAESSTLVPHIYIPSVSATNISKAIVSFIF